MRDPRRIRKFCNRLAAAWELLPDLRFGQLVYIIFDQMNDEQTDPFYVEDDAMIECIEQYIERNTGVALHE